MRPQRADVALAVGCGGWAAVFLAPQGAPALSAALLLAIVIPLGRRRAVLGAFAALAVILLIGVLDRSAAGLSCLAGLLMVPYSLGRHATARGAAAPGCAFVAVVSAVYGASVANAVFSAFLFGTFWTLGRLVQLRAADAAGAAATAAELAARDPGVLAARAVAVERARLAGETLAVVRDAVSVMHRHAVAAEADLDVSELAAIQNSGRAAVGDLRRLLGLLRSEPQQPSPTSRADAGDGRRRWTSARWVDPATAAVLSLACVMEAALPPDGQRTSSVVLSVGLAATVAARRRDPVIGCVAAAAVSALAIVLDVPLLYGMSTAATWALLAWSVAVDRRPYRHVPFAVLVVVTLIGGHLHTPGNEAMNLAFLLLPAVAGHLWAQRDRDTRTAAVAAAVHRDELDAATGRAVRAERLRVARDLHDVVSHAVGVMVLQAGAAQALRTRDPERARTAVRAVQAAGSRATTELHTLFDVLDAGAVGSAGLATPSPPVDLSTAITALADRIRDGGIEVTLSGPVPAVDDPATSAVTFRIVQEALTNAARHAPGSRVAVTVVDRAGSLEVSVCDDGGPDATAARHRPGPDCPGAGGFGLVGLEERVRALGGELSAGRRPDGGFTVAARLPAGRQSEAAA